MRSRCRIINGKVMVRKTHPTFGDFAHESIGAVSEGTAPTDGNPLHQCRINMDELTQELAALDARSLRRRLQVVDEVLPGGKVRVAGQVRLNLSSNDYLGLSQDPRIIAAAQAAAAKWGAGAGASRLVVGHLALHEAVEARLADFKGTEAAVIFPTGYMANVGTISALVGPGDVIFSDRLNHASIYDGIKLSGAALQRFPHRDLNRLEQLLREAGAARRRLIITDSVFSVDGDLAPLTDLAALKARYGAWLMVDEAHATGVLGAKGGGLAEALGLTREVDIHLGTFSKALGSQGGFVAGDRRLVDYLHNRARSFIYSTALAPMVLGAIDQALQIVVQEPERRLFLQRESENFRQGLLSAGLDILGSETQIIPVLVGENDRTLKFAARLMDQGLMAVALRPPTVPPGRARVRFSLSAAQAADDLSQRPGGHRGHGPSHGSGVMTTLVFFHGWGASGRVWERQAAAFGDRMPVLTPTVPVWEVGWFAEYLRGLDLQECLLVGWSLGGMLLLEALSRLTDPPPGRAGPGGGGPGLYPASGLPLGTTPGRGPGHAPGPYEKPAAGAG